MNQQQQLEKARQELLEYQEIVRQDQRFEQETYQRRLEQMRNMQQTQQDISYMIGLTKGDISEHTAVAMAMGELNIEARIRRLENLAVGQNLVANVPEENIVAQPVNAPVIQEVQQAPVQQVSRWQKVKNWFKNLFSRNRQGAPTAQGASTTQEEPVQQQEKQNVLQAIETTQVNSHVNEVQRFEKANPDDAGIVTAEELKVMQKKGVRGGDGDFITKRAQGLLNPILAQIKELFDNLNSSGFDFDAAVSEMKDIQVGIGLIKVNEATVTMTKRAIHMWNEYLENEHIQEYISMLYESVGQVLVDNVRDEKEDDNAIPNEQDFDDHIMEIMPTRGLECFRNQAIRADISGSNRVLATQCSKLMSKMSHVEKDINEIGDPTVVNMLQPVIEEYRILKSKISKIGAPMRAKRLKAIQDSLSGK